MLNALDSGKVCAGVFFDLSRAFDTIDHDRLLEKIKRYGVRGTPHSWLSSYLQGRTQRVKLRGKNGTYHMSHLRAVLTGVPQGSILGPILFVLFINDLLVGDFHTILYADDTSALVSSPGVPDLVGGVSLVVANMVEYCRMNALHLNGSKTVLMQFSTKARSSSLLVRAGGGGTLTQGDEVKFLGIHVDSRLTWGTHINYVSSRLSSSHYVIWQLRDKVSLETLKMYYFAHVQSLLSYGVTCWGHSSQVITLLKLQKKILRTMTFKPFRFSCRGLFKELGILTVASLFVFKSVINVKKQKENEFSRNDDSKYNFRNFNMYLIPKHRLECAARGPGVLPFKLFNKLPAKIRAIERLAEFKFQVREFLLAGSFYTLNEFLNDTCS